MPISGDDPFSASDASRPQTCKSKRLFVYIACLSPEEGPCRSAAQAPGWVGGIGGRQVPEGVAAAPEDNAEEECQGAVRKALQEGCRGSEKPPRTPGGVEATDGLSVAGQNGLVFPTRKDTTTSGTNL